MNNGARTLAALLCAACLLLHSVARAQPADPAVWGVYARLLDARLEAGFGAVKQSYAWSWNATRTAILEDHGRGEDDRITALGEGRLARHIDGKHRFTGRIQADGSVVWAAEGFSLTSSDHRVRLDGDTVLLELVALNGGEVARVKQSFRLTGNLPQPALAAAVAASAAGVPPSPPATTALASPPAAADTASTEQQAGPRALSEQDMARLRASMARDKLQRAETLRRQQEEARRAEEARRQQAEFDAQMAAQRAQQEREERAETRRSDDAFASALMGGLNTFKNEMANAQAQRAQQQAMLANLQRQQQQAEQAREREQDRQRQAAAQQQRQVATAPPAQPAQAAQANQAAQAAQARAQAQAAERERQLRESAAAERQRQQQLREQRQAEERMAALAPTPRPAQATQQASTLDDPSRCVSQPSQVRNPNCKDGSAFTMTNGCEQPVDVRLCIKTQQGSWDCGATWGVRPGGSWSYPSCRGASTVFMDVRSAGSNRRFADPP